MIPLLASLAVQAASSAYSGYQNQKQQDALQGRQDDLNNWYNANYNQDYLQTPESKSALKTLSDRIYKNNKIADNKAAVTGQTDESRLAARNNNEQVYSGFVNKLAGNADRYKRYVQSRYDQQEGGILGKMDAATARKNASAMNVAANAANLGKNSIPDATTSTNYTATPMQNVYNSTQNTVDNPIDNGSSNTEILPDELNSEKYSEGGNV